MSITTTVPADRLQPRTWIELDYVSHSRGASPANRAGLLIGMRHSSGLAISDVPYEITSEDQADDLFGEGSEVSVMCRVTFAVWRALEQQQLGGAGRLYAIGVAEPGAGVSATGTITVTGPATESGTFDVIIGGVRCPVNVTSGDSANTIAAAISASIAQRRLQIAATAGVAGAVVTVTYRHKGASGNELSLMLDQAQRLPTGVGVTMSGTTLASGTVAATMTAALDAALARDYRGIGTAEGSATAIAALSTYIGTAWGPSSKRFGRVFTGSRGSIAAGTTLASGSNRPEATIIGCTGIPAHPSHLAAAGVAIRTCQDRPSFNFAGLWLPFLPPNVADRYTTEAAVQSVLYGGVSALTADPSGVVKLERLITCKTTEGGARFDDAIDTGDVDTIAELGLLIDAKIARIIRHQNIDDALVDECRSAAAKVCADAEADRWIENSDELASALIAERHPTNRNRIVTQVPASPLAPALQAVSRIVLWTEGRA
jgi:phage tail sheath gpL-like